MLYYSVTQVGSVERTLHRRIDNYMMKREKNYSRVQINAGTYCTGYVKVLMSPPVSPLLLAHSHTHSHTLLLQLAVVVVAALDCTKPGDL